METSNRHKQKNGGGKVETINGYNELCLNILKFTK